MHFIAQLEADLRSKVNPEAAKPMEDYMKNNFSFLGIKTEERRAIFKRNGELYKTEIKANFRAIAWELFNKKEREFHQCAIDLLCKQIKKKFVMEDIQWIEKMIVTNSWWDSVDVIAKYLIGHYLLQFPEKKFDVIEAFTNSDNMWLNRTAIIFQLDYKANTDFDLLKSVCEQHKDSKEFFIQKAIGWALREYSRFNPYGVKEYVNSTNLKPLSQREALRNIK